MITFYGLSTDTKIKTDVQSNAKYYETDTQSTFVWNGSEWIQIWDEPYLINIAEGNIVDHEAWSLLGIGSSVGTTEIDIWEGASKYTWLTAVSTVSVISSEAGDTSAGSGVRTVHISYLNSAGITGKETITMNGTAAVTSTNTMYRINSIHAGTTGGVFMATGNITVSTATSGGTVLGYILAGYTHDRAAIYQVPEGKELYITSITAGSHSATKGSVVTVKSTYDHEHGTVNNFFLPVLEFALSNTIISKDLTMPIKVPEGARIKASAKADAAGAYLTVALRGWLETE